MAIQYAQKYSPIVDEKFRLGLLTGAIENFDYDWVGVETVTVYQIPTVALSTYSLTGANRYGTPAELQNTYQDLAITQDKSFTFTIDRKSLDGTVTAMDAGRALAREIDEVIIPTIDTYRLGVLAAGAGNSHTHASAVSASDAYAEFLTVSGMMDDDKVPMAGRVAYVTPTFYNYLKQDDAFIKSGDLSQEMLIRGQVGEVDGTAIIKVPSSYLPTKSNFVICLGGIIPAPIKLTDYKIHYDAPGISGALVEGRIRHDAFILTNKADGIGYSVNTN